MSALPFKYREKRNKYFKEYMRKWRAEKRNQNLETASVRRSQAEDKNQAELERPKLYEILAA
jgi:hypothetical protein